MESVAIMWRRVCSAAGPLSAPGAFFIDRTKRRKNNSPGILVRTVYPNVLTVPLSVEWFLTHK